MNITIGPIKNKATWRAVVIKAQAMGYRWRDGDDSLADEGWDRYKEESYITLGKVIGQFWVEVSEEDISISSKECAEDLGFPIITPDKYMFGVDPGDKFIYQGKEVEYVGCYLEDCMIVLNYIFSIWGKYEKKEFEERMTNYPEIGASFKWSFWEDLEPIKEEITSENASTYEDKEELTPAEKIDRAFLYHCKKRDNPYKGQSYYKKLTFSDEQNKSEDKTMLQELTNALKKHLPGDIKKQYKAGFRNGDLELTKKGVEVLVEEILTDKYNDELTEKAEEIIKEHEEE